jgi:glycosyltransferase involved in cell wall biosynthesis
MSTAFKISVIIPTYNCGRYIRDSIRSAIDQSRSPDEILIVDDGSTDETYAIVENFNDERIRYFKRENAGVSAARNFGLDNAKGDFIAFLDADDKWHPDMLREQEDLLSSQPSVAFCFTNFRRFDDRTGELLSDQFAFYPEIASIKTAQITDHARLITQPAFETLVNFGEFPAYVQCIMFRRTAVADIRFNPKLRVCEDAEFVLRACLKGAVAFNESVLTFVRRHESNATRDFGLLNVNKLEALDCIRTADLNAEQRNALNARLIKASIDAGVSLIRARQLLRGLAIGFRAWRHQRCWTRKSKGSVRLLIVALQMATDRRSKPL